MPNKISNFNVITERRDDMAERSISFKVSITLDILYGDSLVIYVGDVHNIAVGRGLWAISKDPRVARYNKQSDAIAHLLTAQQQDKWGLVEVNEGGVDYGFDLYAYPIGQEVPTDPITRIFATKDSDGIYYTCPATGELRYRTLIDIAFACMKGFGYDPSSPYTVSQTIL